MHLTHGGGGWGIGESGISCRRWQLQVASPSCPRLPRNLVREGVLVGAECCPGASEPPTAGCRANGYLGVKDWRGLLPTARTYPA